MKKLVVAGCSVSDWTQVDKVWGEYVAKHLGLEYMHLAAGCGSNYRMWRLLTTHIRNGTITSDDTVLVQYTTLERTEFWSAQIDAHWQVPNAHLRDSYTEGSIIKFKTDSHKWSAGIERKFMKMYERFIGMEFEREKFINNHIAFQCLAKEYNIHNLYFVKVGKYGYNGEDVHPTISKYKDNFLNYNDIFDNKKWHLKGDPFHLSATGHTILADRVIKVIESK
jgi:hypothetical protein